jgi:hypothetical protein
MPFEAAILPRMRSPVTSCSNWAKDNNVQGSDPSGIISAIDCRID